MTNQAGELVWRAEYLPFGELFSNEIATVTNSLRLPGQYFDSETGLSQNWFRDYSAKTGRYVEADPIGLAGGSNPYEYAEANPVSFVDPSGLDILVIENRATENNPVGHTALAVTVAGVYSFGNNTPLEWSLRDYLLHEARRRDTDLYLIKTTPAQDAAVLEYLRQFSDSTIPDDFLSKYFTDNCSMRSNRGLDAAGVPDIVRVLFPGSILSTPNGLPGTAGIRAILAGASHYHFPRGATILPPELQQFEPY